MGMSKATAPTYKTTNWTAYNEVNQTGFAGDGLIPILHIEEQLGFKHKVQRLI